MPFHQKEGLKYFSFETFDAFGVPNAIYTRHGGVSKPPWSSLNIGGTVGDDPQAVWKNIQLMFHTIDREFTSRYDGWQVHGDRILRIEEPRPEGMSHIKTDGLITNRHPVTLLMRFADCVPILLFDPKNSVVGIVHAGWKGTVLKVAAKAVTRMNAEYGSNPADIVAGIGPSIGPEDYEIGEEVVSAVKGSFTDNWSQVLFQKNKAFHFDLWKANECSLQEAGISKIELAGISTYSNTDDWYSHRRENGRTGRFGAVIALPEEDR
jgi:YfiH family protein